MPNIKPVSNYNDVLRSCQVGEAVIKLLSKLTVAEDVIKTGEEWKSLDDLRKALEV